MEFYKDFRNAIKINMQVDGIQVMINFQFVNLKNDIIFSAVEIIPFQ